MPRARFSLLVLLLAASGTVAAAQTVLGISAAQRCYESATFDPSPQAVRDCTAAIKDGSLTRTELAATYSNRGILWASRGRLDLALADQNEALAIDPESARAYLNRGNVHYRAKRYDDARADYDRAIEIVADFPQAFFNRALANKATGDLAAARSDLEKAIALAPGNQRFIDARAQLER